MSEEEHVEAEGTARTKDERHMSVTEKHRERKREERNGGA